MKRERDFDYHEIPPIGPIMGNSPDNSISSKNSNHHSNNISSNLNNNNATNAYIDGDVDATNNTDLENNNNKEQDRFLPIANVGRIMKKVIPGNGKISKDARETVQECVSEFISFVTGEASDKCQREKRKTINGDDILWAITTLGFDDYVNPLKQYLAKYREIEGEKLNLPKQRFGGQNMQQHEQKPNVTYNNVYSPPNLISHQPFVPTDQSFPLPFPQNSIQTMPFPQQEHVGHWLPDKENGFQL